MFTGIIEALGKVRHVSSTGTNKTFWLESPITESFKVDQSIAHNGACLTVEEIKDGLFRVTAVRETLQKTNLDKWQVGSLINLERSLLLSNRLDGHLVQGHVDCLGVCKKIDFLNGSTELTMTFDPSFSSLIIEKGSIALNGISLTIFNTTDDQFQVAIIPYTWEHTNLKTLKENDLVNIEFDLIGKYVLGFKSKKIDS